MDRQKAVGPLLLLVTAFIWGTAFVAQDIGAAHVDGFTFQAARNLLGAATLFVVWLVKDGIAKRRGSYMPPSKASKRYLLWGSLGCGVLLCVAMVLQQYGITNNVTSPGKDAFITDLYIVFVPIIGLFTGKRSQPHVYVCVVVALLGLWMLCMGGSGISVGDVQVILCSVAFSFHIALVDHVAPHVDGVKLSCLQFLVAGVLSAIGMLIVEQPSLTAILAAWFPICYAGIFSAAVAYTLQILGQARTQPTVACLIMSLEAVFAVACSMLLLPGVPHPTAREWIGMVLILAAIIVSQLPLRYGKKKAEKSKTDT